MKNKKKLQEDMISPGDSPAFDQASTSTPGSDFQHPGMMPQPNMDTLSLVGPGNKSTPKKNKKKEASPESKISNKVLTFEEFINRDLS